MPTPKERAEALCRALDKASGSDLLQVYDLDAILAALTDAIAEEREECAKVAARMSSDSPTYEAHLWAADISRVHDRRAQLMQTTPAPLRVDAAIYDQGVSALRYWAGLALVHGEWRRAAQLTVEANALRDERRRIYGREEMSE